MNPPTPSNWLHRFAWFTAALTILLPVSTGAAVTTLKAGMVFSDWPSSDGYFILTYPWLSAARDQFVEHGHRLSGMTIALLSLCLAIVTWRFDHRPHVRKIAVAIFAVVFVQAMLGGARVLLDEQAMALLHGDFAALVFSLMAILVLITSNGWDQRRRLDSMRQSQLVTGAGFVLVATLIAQYVMGGFLRHLRERSEFAWAWMVHPWFAVVVLIFTMLFAVSVRGSQSSYLRNCANGLMALTVAQSLVGLATWYFRYGVPSWGVVAQQDSMPQIVICSLHKVVGMLTMTTSVLAVVCCRAVKPLHDPNQVAVNVGPNIAGAAT